MKKQFGLPLMICAVLVAACGKSEKAETVASNPQPVTITQTTTSTSTSTSTNTQPNQPNNGLQAFCQSYGGLMDGSLCKINQTRNNGAWISFQIGTLNTGIWISAGNRVSVQTSGSPTASVGGAQQATGSGGFVSTSSGYLTFNKNGLNSYNVSQIQIQSCYSAVNQLATCP